MSRFDIDFFGYFSALERKIRLSPLNLGGVAGSGGGGGGPPGGFIGMLPQTRVGYDTTEAEISGFISPNPYNPSGILVSGSLLDNLNHIRYRLAALEGGGVPSGEWITEFIDLLDTPTTYAGEANKFVTVKSDESGLEFTAGATTFLDLTDVPSSYSGQSLKSVRVTSGETGLEFYTPSTGDSNAIHDNIANEIQPITEKTTPADNDVFLIEDSADSYNKKSVKASNIIGNDATAIHTDIASEINGITEKTSPQDNDIIVIEDSSDSYNKKRVKLTHLPSISGSGGSDSDAIHVNVSGEVYGITEKMSPADTDVFVIEDSEDSYNKKRIQLSNFPFTTSGGGGGGYTEGAVVTLYNGGSNYTVNYNTYVDIPWDTEEEDTDSMWDAGDPTKLVCKTAGLYEVGAYFQWHTPSTNVYKAWLEINDDHYLAADYVINAASYFSEVPVNLHRVIRLAVNDYIKVLVRHNDNPSNTLEVYQGSYPVFWIKRIG